MKKILRHLQKPSIILAGIAVAHLAVGQSSWGGAGADQNWSTGANWSAGGIPSAGSSVAFPDGAYPVTTNLQGAVNNIVPSSTTIASLTYGMNPGDYVTTLIPSGVILTVTGNLTSGGAAEATVANITGGGSLIAGANGTSILTVQSTAGTAILNLSALTNFSFNYGGAGGPINLGASAGGSGTLDLAGGSNNITANSLSLGTNNTSGTATLNLGNGTNIINADIINLGLNKTHGYMQFLNNAGGGLRIADHTGAGRATINLATEPNGGSTTAESTGSMALNGGTVNVLAGTLTMANRAGRNDSPGALAILSFNSGIVDATTINMAANSTGGSAFATNTVGGSGILKIGNGGMSMVNQGGTAGAGTLIITGGGTVICSNNIYKNTANGVATITMNGGSLNMASIAGTIGVTNNFPIDNLNITNSTLTLTVAAAAANAVVNNFNPDTATTNTINIGSLPSITAYPSIFPVLTYTTPGGNLATGGILPNLALGTLPTTFGTYHGYLSNDVASLTIWLVIASGPSTAKADEWGGGVNNQWDTTSLNWTNNGAAVKYNNGDFATFDDLGQTTNVNLTAARNPGTLTFNNNVLNYTLSGSGSIGGPVGLVMTGTASVTLAETGGDSFSLGVTSDAGTLVLDEPSSTISGGLMINGGAIVQIGDNNTNGYLPSGGVVDQGTLIFDRSNNFTVATVIADNDAGGAVIQNGSGTLILSAANTYSGSTTVNKGTLALTGSGSIADSSAVQVGAATLDVSGVSAAATTLASLTLSNSSLNVKVGYLQTNLSAGNLTMLGSGNTISVISLPPIAYYPVTNTLLETAGGISGYNFHLGSLPSGSAGTIAESGDGNSVLLTLTSGPTNGRPSVTWSGVDALGAVNTNWSDAQNWQTPGVPTAAEPVFFNDTATAGATPFDQSGGVGSGGVIDQANVNNIVDVSLTNAALNYANDSGSFHNTQIASGKTLTVAGSLTVDGASGAVSILGGGAAMKVINKSGNIYVAAPTASTLDMSGLDTFTAIVNQIGVAFNYAGISSAVNGTWYLARTNVIITGAGNYGAGASLVVGGAALSAAGTGQLYLGQTNSLYLDGIVLGASSSTGDLIEFNPAYTNPVAYIRGINGDLSRVTEWSLGDDSVNVNNGNSGNSFICDFTAGKLNALVSRLIVGQGAQGNEPNASLVTGTFDMGAGNLDVTTLNIGVGDNGKVGGTGIGVMNITNGTLVVNSLGLAEGGGPAITAGTLNLDNAVLVVSNGISIGTGTAGGSMDSEFSTVKILNSGTIGSPGAGLATLTLDGGTLQLNVNGNNAVDNANAADIVATNVITGATTTINIAAVANVSGTAALPLISYVGGSDPTTNNLSLGTLPPGYNGSLIDDTANSSIDLSITLTVPPTPRITGISVSGTTLTINATNGADDGQYVLLGTTNLALPLSEWTPILTNNFNASGNLNLSTQIINSTVPQQFYILSQP